MPARRESSLELAVIGNCQVSGLVDELGRMVWACMPRFDSNPVFCALLMDDQEQVERGVFEVLLEDFVRAEQRYVSNTPILETWLHDAHGGCIKITDFAPRFEKFERTFHPFMFVRHIEPVSGSPRVTVRLRPAGNYGAEDARQTFGSNHVRYVLPDLTLRLTTDASLTCIREERPFRLTRPLSFILGPDESLQESVARSSRLLFEKTRLYWQDWVRGLAVPFEWQEAVIRAAITLKLCSYEDTGAIIAAITSSIPEAAGTSRNWDYRYCWLRDSFFVVHALNRLGATRTMEAYLEWILNVAASGDGRGLQPVYDISGEPELLESDLPQLPGYRGMGPVRLGNEAYLQVQNDVYGAVVLAAAQTFFDRRLNNPAGREQLELLEEVAERAAELYDAPDAGIWEYRGRARVHTFSSVMCWAACDRLARISAHLEDAERARKWRETADRIHAEICRQAWDEEQGCFAESFGGKGIDASMLLLNDLGFLAADDPRFRRTVECIEKHLLRGKHMFRYGEPDDFGEPETAFNICTFWYINALAAIDRKDEARTLFEEMLSCRTRLGLLSEDLDVHTGQLWGNYPQTYSLVGIILGAIRLSKSWEDAF
ncbi:MAG TPA: glycoside hydrolase family 15 protein [Gammaproteobacteria bacterium]|nr:glycoside hydrolase family 15 protein [Gammaproteobacteria bacterium]